MCAHIRKRRRQRLNRDAVHHDAAACLQSGGNLVEYIGKTAAAAADNGSVAIRQIFQRVRRVSLDDRQIPDAKFLLILLNERNALRVPLYRVNMALRRKTGRFHRHRAGSRAHVPDNVRRRNPCLDHRQHTNLLLCHRNLAADKRFVLDSQSGHQPITTSTQCVSSFSSAAPASVVLTMLSSS